MRLLAAKRFPLGCLALIVSQSLWLSFPVRFQSSFPAITAHHHSEGLPVCVMLSITVIAGAMLKSNICNSGRTQHGAGADIFTTNIYHTNHMAHTKPGLLIQYTYCIALSLCTEPATSSQSGTRSLIVHDSTYNHNLVFPFPLRCYVHPCRNMLKAQFHKD